MNEMDITRIWARLDALEHENKKLKAYTDVMNVTMKYFHYHQCFRDDLVVEELLARQSPGIHSEHGTSGVYEGFEHVASWWKKRPNPKGKLIFHAISTPVIEIADDLQTAKGIFLLNGIESGLTQPGQVPNEWVQKERSSDGREIWSHWAFAKYGLDYIFENGEWRIWHFHAYDLCRATFDKNWVSLAQDNEKMRAVAAAAGQQPTDKVMYITDDEVVYLPKADKPTTFHFDYDGLNSQVPLFPPVPKPYTTFEETFEY